jgi:hypothetical protein
MPLVINMDPKIYEGKWKEFQPGVDVLIRPYTRKLIRKVMALATVAGPGAESRVDPELWDRYLYREIIGDIKGLVSPDGGALEIAGGQERNEVAIDAVCDQVEGFAAWALAESKADAAAMTALQEAQVKNSKGSHDGRRGGPKA